MKRECARDGRRVAYATQGASGDDAGWVCTQCENVYCGKCAASPVTEGRLHGDAIDNFVRKPTCLQCGAPIRLLNGNEVEDRDDMDKPAPISGGLVGAFVLGFIGAIVGNVVGHFLAGVIIGVVVGGVLGVVSGWRGVRSA